MPDRDRDEDVMGTSNQEQIRDTEGNEEEFEDTDDLDDEEEDEDEESGL